MIFRHLLNMRSHPTWVRGLKLILPDKCLFRCPVAPYVGAWIETEPHPQTSARTRIRQTLVTDGTAVTT